MGVFILDVGLTVLILMQALMPPNRGSLTVAKYYENYNFYADYLRTGLVYLNGSGRRVFPDGAVIDLSSGLESDFSVTLTDGVVTGVTVTRRAETDSFLWLSDTEMEVALLAFAGSLPEINCINLQAGKWVETMEQQSTWDYDLTLRGLHITQSTELDGFESAGVPSSALIVPEGQTAVFRQEFRVELEK